VTTMQPTQRMAEKKKVTQDKKKTKLPRCQGELTRKQKQSSPAEVSQEANRKEETKRKRASHQGGSMRNEKDLPKRELGVSYAELQKKPNKKRRVEAEDPPTSVVLQDNSTDDGSNEASDMYSDADNNDIGPIDERTIQGARQPIFYSLPSARINAKPLPDAKQAFSDLHQEILYLKRQAQARRKQEIREQWRKHAVQAKEAYVTRSRGRRAIEKVEEEKRKWEKTVEQEEERLQLKVQEMGKAKREAEVAVKLHRQRMEATREDFKEKLATQRAAADRLFLSAIFG
jgi:hypothetical protein